MKKFLSFSFQTKILLGYLFILVSLCFLVGYIVNNQTRHAILLQKESFLLGYARTLDARLEAGGYDAILRRRHAENASREEKIQILSEELTPMGDELAKSMDGLGIGYYSLELDAIITYGPNEMYGKFVGTPISPNHPGRQVMATNTPRVVIGTMVRGNIMNAMHPISRKGRVIGYIWANELTADVEESIWAISVRIGYTLLTCAFLSICFYVFIMRRSVSSVIALIDGVNLMQKESSYRIPPLSGEMEKVAVSINNMADEMLRSGERTRNVAAVLQNVMNNVDSVVYVCNPQNHKLLYANEYVTKIFGEVDFSKSCHEILMHSDKPCSFCPMERFAGIEGDPLDMVLQGERRYGLLQHDFFVKDRLIRWLNNQVVLMSVGTDITERKKLEIAEATNLAQRAFLARMSHELRTPMNGVLGMTHLALMADPPPRQLGYLKKIQSSASLLLGIINDILDFSRIEAGKMEVESSVFDLHTTLQNIRELILPRAESKNIDLVFDIKEIVPRFVEGDELRLSQVLLNLLGNSAKFTSEGRVVLTADAHFLPENKIRLQFSVRDTGIGMSEEQVAVLFQPFSQADASTSRKFGGTGLGLAISKALVELMNGEIKVFSKAGQGSEFSFSIVLGIADNAVADAGQEQIQLAHRQSYLGFNFLLVEDNIINQEIALQLLTNLEAGVDLAENGEEAVKAFLAKDYDLIFMDVRMPVMDGLEAAKRIRASGKHDAASVPIVAMTANVMQEDQDESRQAGMNGHLAKPIDVQALLDVIHSLLKDKLPQDSSN